jgi:mannose-1-phosphate guanylyltransferase
MGGVEPVFWPFSRQTYPKQFFHDVLGTGRTLIQQKDRFEGVVPNENIYVVTSTEYYELTKKQLPLCRMIRFCAEPNRWNTAPCITACAIKLRSKIRC